MRLRSLVLRSGRMNKASVFYLPLVAVLSACKALSFEFWQHRFVALLFDTHLDISRSGAAEFPQ